MAFFTDLLDFVEYSTSVEYSDGHEKNFLSPTTDQVYSKKFHVNWIISFENIDGVYPPPPKKKKKDYWGGGLSST